MNIGKSRSAVLPRKRKQLRTPTLGSSADGPLWERSTEGFMGEAVGMKLVSKKAGSSVCGSRGISMYRC